jgi:hypothetical protein
MDRREVRIELTDVPRFNARPRPFTPREQQAFSKWSATALQHGWIRPSTARHSSQLLFVPKKDTPEPRVCVDYRLLNYITKSRIYAPRSDKFLRNDIAKHTWFTKIDLKDAFYHLSIAQQDRWKTAFRTPHGLFEWNALPMGLKNAPGEFQLYIEEVLSTVLGEHVCVHIDDILIHTDTKERCALLTSKVITILQRHKLTINEKKSVYLVQAVIFCGFEYQQGTVKPLDRAETLSSWPLPKTPTQLRAFLGLTNQLRDHIPRYAATVSPLYNLTGKEWKWTPTHTKAFLKARELATRTVATTRHNQSHSATLTTDASLFGLGAILSQRGRITAIWSRALTPAERNYPANERELLAVVEALRVWTHLLEVSPSILVLTDSMINATNIKANHSNRRINRWIHTIQAFPLVWAHTPGATNPAYTPSRRPDYAPTPRE